MQYFGGKHRAGWQIANIINKEIERTGWNYIEPFCGSCSVTIDVIAKKRWCLDINPYLIEMWKALQNGWEPPDNISEEEYYDIKNNLDRDRKLSAFVGFGCSWGGKWYGGYARSINEKGEQVNFGLRAKNSLLNKLEYLRDVQFYCKDYKLVKPIKKIIYCDPPYSDTTLYKDIMLWNTIEFWDKMNEWSLDNIVIVSEYSCPNTNWHELPVCINGHNGSATRGEGKERLFIHSLNAN